MNTKLTPSDRRRIAEKVGASDAYLRQCLTGHRDMDPVEAVRIEQETDGEVSRFELCTRRGRQIWPELWQEYSARIEGERDAVAEIAQTPSEPVRQPGAVREGINRRHNSQRENDPPPDAGRRKNLPSPVLDSAAIQQVN